MNFEFQEHILFIENSHEYYVDGKKLPSVSQIIKEDSDYEGIPKGVLDRAAIRGNMVHDAISKSILANDGSQVWHDDTRTHEHLTLYNKFMQYGVLEPLYTEIKVYHPDLWYAGTIDIIGKVNGKWAIVDIKTTAKYLENKCRLQMAGYGNLIGFWYSDRIFDRFILHLDRTSGMPRLHRMKHPDIDDKGFMDKLRGHTVDQPLVQV